MASRRPWRVNYVVYVEFQKLWHGALQKAFEYEILHLRYDGCRRSCVAELKEYDQTKD